MSLIKPLFCHIENVSPTLFHTGDLHPFLIHFPIALFFVALIFDILYAFRKSDTLHSTGNWIVIIAALLTIPTVITGLYAADLGHEDNPFLLVHRNWGLATLFYSILHALLRIYGMRKKMLPAYIFIITSLVNVSLVSITAEYGGTITRGKGLWLHAMINKNESSR